MQRRLEVTMVRSKEVEELRIYEASKLLRREAAT